MGSYTSMLMAAVGTLGAASADAEVFVDLGAQSSRIDADIANAPAIVRTTETGWHLGIGVSRLVGERNEYGVRLELDDMGSDFMLAVRALDYRRHLTERLSIGAFAGAARLDLATPAYGYYFGMGVQVKEVLPGWDWSVDLRYGDKVARDNVLAGDPQGGRPDNFYDVTGLSLYLRHRF